MFRDRSYYATRPPRPLFHMLFFSCCHLSHICCRPGLERNLIGRCCSCCSFRRPNKNMITNFSDCWDQSKWGPHQHLDSTYSASIGITPGRLCPIYGVSLFGILGRSTSKYPDHSRQSALTRGWKVLSGSMHLRSYSDNSLKSCQVGIGRLSRTCRQKNRQLEPILPQWSSWPHPPQLGLPYYWVGYPVPSFYCFDSCSEHNYYSWHWEFTI